MAEKQDREDDEGKSDICNHKAANLLHDIPETALPVRCEESQSQLSNKIQKKVRWNDTPIEISSFFSGFQDNSLSPSCEMTMDEDRPMWNKRRELKVCKQYVQQLAAAIMKREKPKADGIDSLISRVYKTFTLSPISAVSEDDFDRLVKWMRNCPSHRGIEHLIAPSIGKERKENRALVIRTIVQLQRRSRICPEELTEILSKTSMELSRNSCEFARVIGLADAISIMPISQRQRLAPRSHST
jgi:glycine cleavage system regulatory protein